MRLPSADREEKRVTHGSDTLRTKIKQEPDFNNPNQRELLNYFIVFRESMK